MLWLLTIVFTALPSPSNPNTVPRSHDLADREAAGDVGDGAGRDDRAEASAQRGEPFELLALLEHRHHRRIADNADERRIADLAGAGRREAGTLAGIV